MFYVYFMQKGYGSVKIGMSKDPESRLKNLQTGNHGDLHIIAKMPFSSRIEALEVERGFHRKFQRYRLKGEWFNRCILRKFKNRAQVFPNVFRGNMKGKFNSYHEEANV